MVPFSGEEWDDSPVSVLLGQIELPFSGESWDESPESPVPILLGPIVILFSSVLSNETW